MILFAVAGFDWLVTRIPAAKRVAGEHDQPCSVRSSLRLLFPNRSTCPASHIGDLIRRRSFFSPTKITPEPVS